MRPSQTILVLEDLRNSFAGPLHRKGIELSLNDNQTVLDVYQQWLLLMIDLGYLHPESLERDARRLLSDMVAKDVLELNNAFAELLGLVRLKTIRGFKALCGKISGHLYAFLREDCQRILRGDVYAARRLVQLFSYTSRLTLRDIDLTQQCLDAYMETENNIPDYFPRGIIRSLNGIIKEWMEPFDPTRIRFRHGPGGVAGHGRTSIETKYKDLSYDALTTYVFGEPWWVTGSIRSQLDRISQTIFVPKSYKTFRTISMEPSALMYLQQGVWGEIDRVVGSNPVLRKHIGFHEQERNQRLAKEGSIARTYATIDLSAASDSVSYSLVKKLFRGTKLLPFLVAARSRQTLLPDGRLIALKKYAPMGSALCFPVETIIFAAICRYVTREHGGTKKYSVFGDDIIVPTHCVDDTILVLETLGFVVNPDKSFTDPNIWFRESCGAEYCDGFDVTPMRVSRRYNHRDRLVRSTSLIDLANSAYTRGYRNLRQFFILKLRSTGYRALFAPTSLHGDNYTNYHLRKRWNPKLHRIECRASSLVSKCDDVRDESIALRYWLESTSGRESLHDGFVASIGRSTVSVQNRWVSKPYELPDQQFIDEHRAKE